MARRERGAEPQIVRMPDGSLWRMEPVGPGPAKVQPVPSYACVVRQYLAATRTADKPATRESKRSIFESCLLPALGSTPIDRVDRTCLLALQARLVSQGYEPRTVNLYLAKAQAVLRWATEELGCAPVRRVRRLRVEPARREVRREHYEALLRAVESGWLRVLLLLCGDAGLRIGEAVALEWPCVGPTLCVCASSWRACRGTTKSGRVRRVPVTARLGRELAEAPRESARVVARPGVQSATVLSRTEPICTRLGLPHLTPHALRHSYASELQRRGAGTAVIRDLLGHGSVAITDAYLHTDPEGLAAAVALLDEG